MIRWYDWIAIFWLLAIKAIKYYATCGIKHKLGPDGACRRCGTIP